MELSTDILSLLQNGAIFLFYVLTLVFTVFTIATTYHWFRFGSSKVINMLSLATFLIVSAPLFITMTLFLSLM